MKRLFFALVSVLMIGSMASAQTATPIPLTAGDTVVNTGTASKVIGFTAGYEGVAIQILGTKISGTVAGTIGIYGSLDGTNFDLIGTAFTATDIATNIKSFYITAPVPVYLKVLWTGAGTMSAKLTVRYVPRRHD